MQWNNRGNVYSVPKPVPGAANYKVKGGGKGGWGNDLILSEDQREYSKKLNEERRKKTRDLMDPDYLPGVLGGDRKEQANRVKVGAGRSVNSRKRHG
jgi:RNA-binding protein NOB1